jgi:hypothetical protein
MSTPLDIVMVAPTDFSPSPPIFDQSGPCSPVGTWLVTATNMGGPGASFRFEPPGDLQPSAFEGWAPGVDLASTPTANGQYTWSLADDGRGTPGPVLTILQSSGLDCAEFATFTATFDAGCATMSLLVHFDNCTGARLYLDGAVTLFRR